MTWYRQGQQARLPSGSADSGRKSHLTSNSHAHMEDTHFSTGLFPMKGLEVSAWFLFLLPTPPSACPCALPWLQQHPGLVQTLIFLWTIPLRKPLLCTGISGWVLRLTFGWDGAGSFTRWCLKQEGCYQRPEVSLHSPHSSTSFRAAQVFPEHHLRPCGSWGKQMSSCAESCHSQSLPIPGGALLQVQAPGPSDSHHKQLPLQSLHRCRWLLFFFLNLQRWYKKYEAIEA